MISSSHWGGEVTEVDTEQKYALGAKVHFGAVMVASTPDANSGEEVWMYVFNDEAATAFAAGDVIIRDPSAATETLYGGLIAASGTVYNKHVILGVAQHAIAAGSYGWIQIKGKCLVKNGTANITADTPISTGGDRAGACIDWADGATTSEASFGMSLEAEATDNTTFDAYINCPGA